MQRSKWSIISIFLKKINKLLMAIIENNKLLIELNEIDLTAKIIGCNSSNSDVFIPRSISHQNREYIIVSIEKGSFKGNILITTIRFPEDSEVRSISKGAFTESYLQNFMIPPNLEKLEEGWCKFTKSLNTILLSPNNHNFLYLNKKFLFGKSDSKSDKFDTFLFSCRDVEKVVIPSTIKHISSFCFSECKNLTSIEFSENSELVSIGKYAFSDTNITEITIPFSVTNINKYSFCWSSLQTINFPPQSKLKFIEKGTFMFTDLKRIKIPSSIIEIKEKAFHQCKSLELIEIDNDHTELISIGQNAFLSTKISSFFFPQNLKNLENGWCNRVPNLNNISISPKNEYFISYQKEFILKKSNNSNEFDVIVFANRNIQKAIIPSFITRIDSFAFSDCLNLNSIEFEKYSQLTSIGEYAFCLSSLTEFDVPSKVEKIEDGSFSSCHKLKSFNISENSELRFLGNEVFSYSLIDNLYIPQKFEQFGEIWCYGTNNLATFSISPLNLNFLNYDNKFILGKTEKKSDKFDVIVFACRKIKKPIIPSHIRSIGPCSFISSCIQEIMIPSYVREIGQSAFANCFNMKVVEFEENSELELIDQMAFFEAVIKKIVIPQRIKKIGNSAFGYCNELKCIEILGDEICLNESCFYFDMMFSIIISLPNSSKVSIDHDAFSNKMINSLFFINAGAKIVMNSRIK